MDFLKTTTITLILILSIVRLSSQNISSIVDDFNTVDSFHYAKYPISITPGYFNTGAFVQIDSIFIYDKKERLNDKYSNFILKYYKSKNVADRVALEDKETCRERNCKEIFEKYINNGPHIIDSTQLKPIVRIKYWSEKKEREQWLHCSIVSTLNKNNLERIYWLNTTSYYENGKKIKIIDANLHILSVFQDAIKIKTFEAVDSLNNGLIKNIFKENHTIEMNHVSLITDTNDFAIPAPKIKKPSLSKRILAYNHFHESSRSFTYGKPDSTVIIHPYTTQKDVLKYNGSSPLEALRVVQFGYGDVMVSEFCDGFRADSKLRKYNLNLDSERSFIKLQRVFHFNFKGTNYVALNYDVTYAYIFDREPSFFDGNNTEVFVFDGKEKIWKKTRIKGNEAYSKFFNYITRLKAEYIRKFFKRNRIKEEWTPLEKEVYTFCGQQNFDINRLIILTNEWMYNREQDKLDTFYGPNDFLQGIPWDRFKPYMFYDKR